MSWRNEHARRCGLGVWVSLCCLAVSLVLPAAAWAQALDLSRESPATRRLRSSMNGRAVEIAIYLEQGQLGIDKDGRLVLRSQAGVPQRVSDSIIVQVQADNADRKALVEAYLTANQLPADKRDVVARELSKRWRAEARPGVWVQTDEGRWVAK